MIVKLKLFAVGVAADKSILQRNVAILEVLKENDLKLYQELSSQLTSSSSKFFNQYSGKCAFETSSLEDYLINIAEKPGLTARLVKFISTPANKAQIENFPVVDNFNESCIWDLGWRAVENKAIDSFTDEIAEREIQELNKSRKELLESLSSIDDKLKKIVDKKWGELSESVSSEAEEWRNSVLEKVSKWEDKTMKENLDQVWKNSGKNAHNQNFMNLWFEINRTVEEYLEKNSGKKEKIKKKLAEIDKKIKDISKNRSEKFEKWINSPEFEELVKKRLTRIEEALLREGGSGNVVKGTAKKFAMESIKRFIKEHPWKVGIASAGLAALTAFGIYKGVKNNNKPAESKVDPNTFNSYKDMFNNR
jgi:ElaB/YqjD/DUF883 family membrane-anchored ribosome-binding protein